MFEPVPSAKHPGGVGEEGLVGSFAGRTGEREGVLGIGGGLQSGERSVLVAGPGHDRGMTQMLAPQLDLAAGDDKRGRTGKASGPERAHGLR